MTNFREASRGLIERGFEIFPLQPGKKIPFAGTRGCKDASKDDEIVFEWSRKWPNANIGVACGEASDIIAIDVDVKAAAGGGDSLVWLWNQGKELTRTLTVRTPTGGLHFYYRWIAGVSNSQGRIAPGIDVRSDGGYVVAPPSVIEGQPYTWVTEAPIVELPAWLKAELTAEPEPPCKTDGNFSDEDFALWLASKTEEERQEALAWAAKRHSATAH